MAEPWRALTILMLVVVPGVLGGLALTIGILFLADHLQQALARFEQAFNTVLTTFLILVFLPVAHAGAHRWFWHVEKRRKAGDYLDGKPIPPMGPEPTDPAPAPKLSPKERLLHIALYAVAMTMLAFIYLPLGHHEAIGRFIVAHSSGRASASSLAAMIIAWLPLVGGLVALFAFMERDMKKVRAGQATGADREKIELRLNWLTAFVTAVVMTGCLCFFAGNLILRYLA